jgi:hypothetical protein
MTAPVAQNPLPTPTLLTPAGVFAGMGDKLDATKGLDLHVWRLRLVAGGHEPLCLGNGPTRSRKLTGTAHSRPFVSIRQTTRSRLTDVYPKISPRRPLLYRVEGFW